MPLQSYAHDFWLIWSPRGRRLPKYKHRTEESAITEADRLSALLPGRHFYVLKCIGFAMVGPEQPTKGQLARAAREAAAKSTPGESSSTPSIEGS